MDFKWLPVCRFDAQSCSMCPEGTLSPQAPLLGLGLDLESPKDRTTEQQNSH